MSDSNSKNNNSQGFKNSRMDMREICMSRGKFLKPWQVTDKIIEWIFYTIHIQHLMSDSNSKNNKSQGFKNSRMDMRGSVWVGESFSSHDKWQIKLLSEFLYKSHSIFNEWL